MTTLVVDQDRVQIPPDLRDLASFRRWVCSADFPQAGRICYLTGEVWVDMSKEQVFSHNQVKGEYTRVLGGLAKANSLGRFFPDGVLLTNPDADLSCQPDGMFVSRDSLRRRKVRLREGAEEGPVELEGTPDMVLEVVSPGSVDKDTITLRDLYWLAGIQEYWLVDARGQRLEFDILHHGPRGYVGTRKQGGWVKSAVFATSFRLLRQEDELGHPEFTLEVRR